CGCIKYIRKAACTFARSSDIYLFLKGYLCNTSHCRSTKNNYNDSTKGSIKSSHGDFWLTGRKEVGASCESATTNTTTSRRRYGRSYPEDPPQPVAK
ncbi:hypothetical protein, partial [Desulfuromonas thiophila]|uniref:hypothetical protein n=1 Tax=Desulfuromonas thiophila TaxID=57664 RepID=UPI0024A964D6